MTCNYVNFDSNIPFPREGVGTPLFGPYRYMLWNRVWLLRFSVPGPFVTVFVMWSLDRVGRLYYLIVECENARLNQCLGLQVVWYPTSRPKSLFKFAEKDQLYAITLIKRK